MRQNLAAMLFEKALRYLGLKPRHDAEELPNLFAAAAGFQRHHRMR